MRAGYKPFLWVIPRWTLDKQFAIFLPGYAFIETLLKHHSDKNGLDKS
jgi:uncharacterized membrane protein